MGVFHFIPALYKQFKPCQHCMYKNSFCPNVFTVMRYNKWHVHQNMAICRLKRFFILKVWLLQGRMTKTEFLLKNYVQISHLASRRAFASKKLFSIFNSYAQVSRNYLLK